MRLASHYSWYWCAPARGALLSGKYPNFSGYTQAVDGSESTAPGSTTTALDTAYSSRRYNGFDIILLRFTPLAAAIVNRRAICIAPVDGLY